MPETVFKVISGYLLFLLVNDFSGKTVSNHFLEVDELGLPLTF